MRKKMDRKGWVSDGIMPPPPPFGCANGLKYLIRYLTVILEYFAVYYKHSSEGTSSVKQ